MAADTPSPVAVDNRTTASDRGGGLFMIVVAAAFGAATWYLFDLHMGQSRDKPDAAAGVITGIALGIAVWALVAGIMRLSGKRLGRVRGVVLLVLCAVAGGFVEPRMVIAQKASEEQRAWDALQASGKGFEDYQTYERWTTNPRPGTRGNRALAEAKHESARLASWRTGRVEVWRGLISKCRSEQREFPGENMTPAIEHAHAELAKLYAAGLLELGEKKAKASATKPASTAVGENAAVAAIKEDPAMQAAFRTILERLAGGENDVIYLAFATDAEVTTPPAADTPPKDLVDPGDAFAPSQDVRRYRSFARGLEETLTSAFTERLVTLRSLDAGDKRDGRVVLDVKCSTRRLPGGMVLTREGKAAGTLFNIEVVWDLSISDVDGKVLAKSTSRSHPGDSLQFRQRASDPDHAAYSVMMDSAYYNYCRELTGRLGLIPPPERAYFVFER